jgi:hypothetical protein
MTLRIVSTRRKEGGVWWLRTVIPEGRDWEDLYWMSAWKKQEDPISTNKPGMVVHTCNGN